MLPEMNLYLAVLMYLLCLVLFVYSSAIKPWLLESWYIVIDI